MNTNTETRTNERMGVVDGVCGPSQAWDKLPPVDSLLEKGAKTL